MWLLALVILLAGSGIALQLERSLAPATARYLRGAYFIALLPVAFFLVAGFSLQQADETFTASAHAGLSTYHTWHAPSWMVLWYALMVGGAALYFVVQLVLYVRHRRQGRSVASSSLAADA
jgi:hypothetical protein